MKIFLNILLIWILNWLRLTECQTCLEVRDRPRDRLWGRQWYLQNSNNYDMNVLPAWRNCVNGTGITVGVVDKGVQNHRDLVIDRHVSNRQSSWYDDRSGNRYVSNRQSSWYDDWIGNRYVSNRQSSWYDDWSGNRLKHGTRSAGIIAAKKNTFGIIGIAFAAKIADITIAETSVFEDFDARLLHYRSNVIDVYSCSFANFHTGTKTYPLTTGQETAFRRGTTSGRGGRGSVYVFATGNSGGSETSTFTDSCAYDRLVTNRYVISVAGIQHDLQKVPNGEACSAMMVAAFTARAGARDHKVVTTDINNGTTEYFNQNSAAAPMVSGAVALALSAKPSLSYRDIMHLLVETSRSNLREDYRSKFFRNAANLYVSSYFGFGLLDIGALVEKSKTWTNVPQKTECTRKVTLNAPLQHNRNNFIIRVDSCSTTYTEHVEVTLKVNHPDAGQIQWTLVSPHGTNSIILPGRGLDPVQNMSLTVLTVQMWGENPNGYWRLEPKARFDRKLDQGRIESAEIKIHGFVCDSHNGRRCLPAVQQTTGNWEQWGVWSQCSGTCGEGTKIRRRVCRGSRGQVFCEGSDIKDEQCPNTCPTQTAYVATNREGWSNWSQYTQCSVTCGSGLQTRFRTCNRRDAYGRRLRCYGDRFENRICTMPACPSAINRSGWSDWGGWTQCSVTCGSGFQTRDRLCNRRDAYGRRLSCNGDRYDSKICALPACQRAMHSGGWSSWSQWSQCSVSCGSGQQERYRTCNGRYSYGRISCYGNRFDMKICSLPECPQTSCLMRRDNGYNCRQANSYIMWYYSAWYGLCYRFRFMGCGGNGNKFLTESDCLRACRN